MDTQKWWKVSSLCLKWTLTVKEVNYFVYLSSEKNYPMVRTFQRKKYFVAWEITKCHPSLFEGAKMTNRFYALNRKMFWHQNKTAESLICGNNSVKLLQFLFQKVLVRRPRNDNNACLRPCAGFFIPFHKDDVLWSSINNVHRVNKSRHGLIRGYERYLVPVTLLGNQITWKIPVGQKLNIELDVSSPLSKSACLWSTGKATRLNEPRILSVEDALWVVCLRLRAWWRDFHHNSTNESIIARWASV